MSEARASARATFGVPPSGGRTSTKLFRLKAVLQNNNKGELRFPGTRPSNVMVRMRGLEPPRCHHHRLLRPARLPVPPHPREIRIYEPDQGVSNVARASCACLH